MDLVNVHAAALLALPVVTGILCLLVPHHRPTRRQVTIAAALALGAIFVVLGLTSHLCHAGNPAMQCLFGGACIWLIIMFVKSRWIRAIASILMVGVMFGLSVHYVNLVHSRAWVGNVHYLATIEMVMSDHLEWLQDTIKGLGDDDAVVYPKGWVRESPLNSDLKEALGGFLPYRMECEHVWHSAFTRLIKVNRTTQDFWYPGGRRSDAADGIELRDVP